MSVYVASKSSNWRFALDTNNIIEVVAVGLNPESDAKSYARDYTTMTDQPAWVYEVDLSLVVGYKVNKEVVAVVPPK